MIRMLALALLLCAVLGLDAVADDLPYPAGQSRHELEGLATDVVLPEGLSAEAPASLLVVLHGNGGTGAGMARSFAHLCKDGYVICAPKSRDLGWDRADVDKVLLIGVHLLEVLPIDPARVHVVGFSNGGWNLAPLAFSDELKPCSATWIAAGYDGGTVPKWAATGLGVIALAGTEDANARHARATVPALRGKVRSVEARFQEGLGHAFPRELTGYHDWWLGVQEGRLVAGDDRSFEWTTDLDAAIAGQADVKKGGVFVWIYATEDTETEAGRNLQQSIFFDAELRFLAGQIPCVKLDATAHAERITELGVKTSPALVVIDRKGKVKKRFEGKIKASKVARTLRGIVPVRRMPDE